MATSVADLAINVSANIASAVEGMLRLGSSVDKVSAQIDSLSNVGASFAKSFVKTLAAGLTVKALVDFVAAGIDAQAKMHDLAESVGTTASALSSLLPAARLSGTSMEVVAQASAKFSKSLVEVQSGTGAAARAFTAFGFTARDAARFLQDPVQGMFELSKRSQQFANDGNLVAARMALMGRNAAQLAPFLKELAAQSELTATMTDRQTAAADALQDQWATFKLSIEQFRSGVANALIPLFQQLLEAINGAIRASSGFADTLREMAAEGTFNIWVFNVVKGFAIIGEAIYAVIKAISAFSSSVMVIIADLKSMSTQIGYFATAGFAFGDQMRKATAEREAAVAEANKRWSELWNYNATVVSDSISRQIRSLELGRIAFHQWAENSDRWDRTMRGVSGAAIAPPPPKPPSVGGLGGDGKNKIDEFARALAAMQKMLREAEISAADLGKTVAEKTAPSIKKLQELMVDPKWATFSVQKQEEIARLAEQAAAVHRLVTAYELQQKAAEELVKIRERTSAIAQREIEALNQTTEGLAEQLEALQREGEEIGRTQAQLNALIIARQNNTIRIKEEQLAVAQSISGNEAQIAAYEAQLRLLTEIRDVTSLNQASTVFAQQAETARVGWLQAIEDIADAGAGFLEDLIDNGSSAFENLWKNFQKWALAAFARIAAEKIVVSIVGSLGGGFGAGGLGAAGGLLGGGGGGGGILEQLMGGQGGGGLGQLGGLASSALSSFALSGAGTALGLSSATAAAGGMLGGLSAATGVAATAMTTFGTAALAAIPVVGWIAAAGMALWSVFGGDDPSETKGRIGIRPPGAGGFEDEQSSSSKLGQVGFLDVDTMYFSGEAAKVLSDVLAGALDAFASRMDTEGKDRLAKILQETTFDAFEGTFSTEDFLKKFGGQALQQVVEVAFGELEPALAAVVKGFSGTAQEVANFSNSLLAIYDVTRDLPDAVRENIYGALDATQETADKVLAFAAVLMGFGDAIEGLGPQLEALDPESIVAFVDALGGAQAVAASFGFLAQNFIVDAERFDLASQALIDSFAAIELTIEDLANAGLTSLPRTHEEFLRLLNSFDLTTVAGREAYSSVIALAQGFVLIHGTAEQAAQAVAQQAEANRELIASATEFFTSNFYTPFEQASERIAQAMSTVDEAAAQLGVEIPRTIGGFRAMLEGMQAAGLGGTELYNALILLAPAIYEIDSAVTDVASAVSDAAESLNVLTERAAAFNEMVRAEAATAQQSRLGAIESLAGGAGDLGDQLSLKIKLINEQINQALEELASPNPAVALRARESLKELGVPLTYGSNAPGGTSPLIAGLVKDLARFTVLEAQFDAERGGQLLNLEKWYAEQQAIFSQYSGTESVEAMAALKSEFDRKWVEIVEGIAGGVDGTIGELERLRAALADWLKSVMVGDLSPLKPLERLDQARLQFEQDLGLAMSGDKEALADITKSADQYLRIARDLHKSSAAYSDIFDFVTKMVAQLAGTAQTGLPIAPELPPRVAYPPELAPRIPDAAGDLHGDIFPDEDPIMQHMDSGAAALAVALPANGGRLASSDDIMKLAERVDAVIDAVAALADANTGDSLLIVDELMTVRRTISGSTEMRK